MKKEDIMILAQILSGMKDACAALEKAESRGDSGGVIQIKKEILHFQEEIKKIL